MNNTTEALKMAIDELDGVLSDYTEKQLFDDVSANTIRRVQNTIQEALKSQKKKPNIPERDFYYYEN